MAWTDSQYLSWRSNFPVTFSEQYYKGGVAGNIGTEGSAIRALNEDKIKLYSYGSKNTATYKAEALFLTYCLEIYINNLSVAINSQSYSDLPLNVNTARYSDLAATSQDFPQYMPKWIAEETRLLDIMYTIIKYYLMIQNGTKMSEDVLSLYYDAVATLAPVHPYITVAEANTLPDHINNAIKRERLYVPQILSYLNTHDESEITEDDDNGLLSRTSALERKVIRLQKVVGESGPPQDYSERLDKMEQQIRDLQSLYVNNIDAAIAQLRELQEWAARFNKAIVYVDP